MNEDLEFILDTAKEAMNAALAHLDTQLMKVRAGKATPMMLTSVMVNYYGASTPLNQVANVTALDGRTLTVQAWEKSMLEEIQKGITNANLGLNPQNNGEMIIINVPTPTEERRRDLSKQAKAEGEHAKIGVRNARKEANDEIKKLKNDGLSEDDAKNAEDEVQEITNTFIAKVDALIAAKEKDIMTV
ncbi:MAG: ribosome recycling factor [Flavobacteriales bacterium CG18_big_fil_WC_8_21_14_2_50_32_9]|nr:MAG: ribosome recycling factor [Flavobacteriales bacterium CG18_big_fil_WC_8_21_14_2_50_32_9]PJC62111.1 MAG: ribosome recycling factor [Flavobacteriales bacterium CG_4_9_14_0_2_um_filter_32_27]